MHERQCSSCPKYRHCSSDRIPVQVLMLYALINLLNNASSCCGTHTQYVLVCGVLQNTMLSCTCCEMSSHAVLSCHAVLPSQPCQSVLQVSCCASKPMLLCHAVLPYHAVLQMPCCAADAMQTADLTVADRNLAMRSCKTGIFRTSLTVGRRLGSVRSVMSTRSFRPFE